MTAHLHVVVAVGQEGEGGPAGGVGVVDVVEYVDGLDVALLLDQAVDGRGVLTWGEMCTCVQQLYSSEHVYRRCTGVY